MEVQSLREQLKSMQKNSIGEEKFTNGGENIGDKNCIDHEEFTSEKHIAAGSLTNGEESIDDEQFTDGEQNIRREKPVSIILNTLKQFGFYNLGGLTIVCSDVIPKHVIQEFVIRIALRRWETLKNEVGYVEQSRRLTLHRSTGESNVDNEQNENTKSRIMKRHDATFHISKRVEQLINDVETFYSEALEEDDRARTMKRLRVPPLEEQQSLAVTFRVEVFVVPVAINVYGWSSFGVNHVLIFEIDPQNHLTYEQF
ncbi:unnamed protein product [Rotaria sp. Silwood1]|nr:unnamed protein product [Rotaria sp. Silwood1]CAF1274502.1 unnamed protein product [Rotaria sp. Silwood1]CAF3483737.1 unnamed protein product [Rotaria sp. Silwood1]CAF3493125.1 unnamed protein product [Rotaria sp. Silwood1]CAF4957673.1 unnamed protein product [Rotaria sp. Silwood1]